MVHVAFPNTWNTLWVYLTDKVSPDNKRYIQWLWTAWQFLGKRCKKIIQTLQLTGWPTFCDRLQVTSKDARALEKELTSKQDWRILVFIHICIDLKNMHWSEEFASIWRICTDLNNMHLPEEYALTWRICIYLKIMHWSEEDALIWRICIGLKKMHWSEEY